MIKNILFFISNHIFNWNNAMDGCPPQKHLEVMDHAQAAHRALSKWGAEREKETDTEQARVSEGVYCRFFFLR
jgi:hypothetical protein